MAAQQTLRALEDVSAAVALMSAIRTAFMLHWYGEL
jgi:hypothetical protein